MSEFPKQLRYTKEHEWVLVAGDTVTVGITDYAQGELGDIIFLELPELGETFAKGEPFGTVEAVKTVEEIYAPIGGELIAINERLADEPELVNDSPFGDGWLIKLRMKDPAELTQLMDAAAYRALVGE